MRNKHAELAEAVNGHFGPHHALAARQILDQVDFIDASVTSLWEQIAVRTEPFASVFDMLSPVPGLSRLSIDVIIAETGGDIDPLPERGTPRFLGWSLSRNYASAGKRPPGRHHTRQPVVADGPWSSWCMRRRVPRTAPSPPGTIASPTAGARQCSSGRGPASSS